MQITTNNYQWAIDLLFGMGLLLPIGYIAFVEPTARVMGISLGIGIGYVLHITQKMLIFDEILKKSVQEEAEDRVEEEVEEKLPS